MPRPRKKPASLVKLNPSSREHISGAPDNPSSPNRPAATLLSYPPNISGNLATLPEKAQKFILMLATDYPQFRFCLGQKRFSFRYHTSKSTIFIGPPQPYFALQTLHELGHALCKHQDYHTHVERLKIESTAWQTAKTVLDSYQSHANSLLSSKDPAIRQEGKSLKSLLPVWNQDYIESSLDTYRDWLHAKSRCKKCGLTRYQTRDGKYHCPFCDTFTINRAVD